MTNIDELSKAAMQDYDPDFASAVQPGDLLVGGHNFGYGHPHYPPMRAMRHLGIAGVIAESFSPGFFRGEISMGFPLVTCPGILAIVARWDEMEVDWAAQQVSNLTQRHHHCLRAAARGRPRDARGRWPRDLPEEAIPDRHCHEEAPTMPNLKQLIQATRRPSGPPAPTTH